jgi:hypothetical protein
MRRALQVCIFLEIGPDVQAEQLGHSLAASLDFIGPLPSKFPFCYPFLPLLGHDTHTPTLLSCPRPIHLGERERVRAPACLSVCLHLPYHSFVSPTLVLDFRSLISIFYFIFFIFLARDTNGTSTKTKPI